MLRVAKLPECSCIQLFQIVHHHAPATMTVAPAGRALARVERQIPERGTAARIGGAQWPGIERGAGCRLGRRERVHGLGKARQVVKLRLQQSA